MKKWKKLIWDADMCLCLYHNVLIYLFRYLDAFVSFFFILKLQLSTQQWIKSEKCAGNQRISQREIEFASGLVDFSRIPIRSQDLANNPQCFYFNPCSNIRNIE